MARSPRSYDHRLRELVRQTGDVAVATSGAACLDILHVFVESSTVGRRAGRGLPPSGWYRPASVFDFYRELGELFGVQLSPCNRFGGTKVLRDRWLEHVERTGVCPALIVDEAQEMRPEVLNEIRLLSSWMLDS